MSGRRLTTTSAEATVSAGNMFAAHLRRGDVVALNGTLGSGKTQFVRGIVGRLAPDAHVTSPTFVIAHQYEGRDAAGSPLLVFHADLYRVSRVDELTEAGFSEMLSRDAILLVEWADAFPDALPTDRLTVGFEHGAKENERIISLPDVEGRGS